MTRLVLDTGATRTTITPPVAAAIGYTDLSTLPTTVMRSAVGDEHGHLATVAELHALGWVLLDIEANVADIGYGLDGLLGMDFLLNFNFEIRPGERIIRAQPLVL